MASIYVDSYLLNKSIGKGNFGEVYISLKKMVIQIIFMQQRK